MPTTGYREYIAATARDARAGMRVAAPRDAARLREELGEALAVSTGPTALRFPKGDVGTDIPAVERRAEIDVPCRDVGVPQQFLDHASRGEILAEIGLTDQHIARQVTG